MMKSDPTAKLPVWIAWCGLLLSLAFCWHLSIQAKGIDYYHFWAIPQFEQAELEFADVYNPYLHSNLVDHVQSKQPDIDSERLKKWLAENNRLYQTNLHPTGTPFFYTVNRLFTNVDQPDFGFTLFQLLALVTFTVGSILLSRSFGASWFWATALTAALLLLHRGLHSDLGVANVNRLQFGFFSCSIWFWQTTEKPNLPFRSGIVGLLFGLLIMYKPNTALIVLPAVAMLLDRQYSVMCWFLGGIFCGGLIGWFCILGEQPSATWEAWRQYINVSSDQPFSLESGNYALSRLFSDSSVQAVSIGLIVLLLGIVFGAVSDTRMNATSSKSNNQQLATRYATIACIGLILPLISGPLSWGHYFVLSVPSALAVLFSIESTSRWQTAAGIGLLLCGAAVFSRLPVTPGWLLLISIQLGVSLLLLSGLNLLYSQQQTADRNP